MPPTVIIGQKIKRRIVKQLLIFFIFLIREQLSYSSKIKHFGMIRSQLLGNSSREQTITNLKIKHLLTSTQPFYIQTTNAKIILWVAISANTKKKETHVEMARMIYGDAEAAPALKRHGSHSSSISIFILAFQECWCSDVLLKSLAIPRHSKKLRCHMARHRDSMKMQFDSTTTANSKPF